MTKGVEIEKEVAAELKELRRMKKQYERLKLEHEILKKAIAFTSERRKRSSDVPPLSVAEGFRVGRHCNDLDGQLFCELRGRQPAQ